ncbi:MAG: hypothetical protein AAGE89_09580 [Pseudomonadota bacterium]
MPSTLMRLFCHAALSVGLATAVLFSILPVDRANALKIRQVGTLPLCDHGPVLNKISKRFARVHKFYRDSDLALGEITSVRETAERLDVPEASNRRFCAAHVSLTDGADTTVYYMILDQGGLASIGWGVDFCVQGYDYERAHGAECRSLRAPF